MDVVPLDICVIILGSLYLYDRKVVFFQHENKYHLMKDTTEYIVRAHHMKVNVSLISVGHIKQIVNSSKGCMFMVVRVKEVEMVDSFKVYDPGHKK